MLGEALRELRAAWPRYVAVAVTTLVGVLALAGVAVAGSVGSDLLVAAEEQKNGRAVTVSAEVEGSAAAGLDLPGSRDVTGFVRVLTQQVGPQGAVTAQAQTTVGLSRPGTLAPPETTAVARWTLGDLAARSRFGVLSGHLPRPEQPLEVAVNAQLAEWAQPGLPQSIDLVSATGQRVRAVVVAVVSDAAPGPSVYGDWSLLARSLARDVEGPTEVAITGPAMPPVAAMALLDDSARRSGVTWSRPPKRIDTVEGIQTQIAFFGRTFSLVGWTILGLAGLGVANVGLASIAERARDLVIRRAVGASRRQLFGQVVAEAVLVGLLVGGLACVVVLIATYVVVPRLIPAGSALVTPSFPWQATLTAIAAGLGTGLVGGALPALRAVRLPVARALRE